MINLCHGHRLQAINGGRVLKRKVTLYQRKHLLRMGPIHADALTNLVNIGRPAAVPGEPEAALTDPPLTELEIAGAVAEKELVLEDIYDIIIANDDEEDDGFELDLDRLAAFVDIMDEAFEG